MIELCTKRRMVIAVVGLGLLTLLILILEEALTSGPINQSPTPFTVNQSSEKGEPHTRSEVPKVVPDKLNSKPCWLSEDYRIVEECAPCTGFEISSQSPAICVETGLKEKVRCKESGFTFRSCSSVKSVEQGHFLLFMFSMLLLFVLSLGAVKVRTSQLERKTIKNIEKRLAVGH